MGVVLVGDWEIIELGVRSRASQVVLTQMLWVRRHKTSLIVRHFQLRLSLSLNVVMVAQHWGLSKHLVWRVKRVCLDGVFLTIGVVLAGLHC